MNSKSHDQIQKLALTALFAALCYVIFTFLQIKIPCPAEMPLPCILEMPSAFWPHCFSEAVTADWPELSA